MRAAACSLLLFLAAAGGSGATDVGTSRATFLVGIDIGHSPAAPGALSATGIPEYEFNFQTARLLAQGVSQIGFRAAVLTDDHPALTVPMRLTRSQRLGVQALVSVHHDSVQPRYLREQTLGGRAYRYSDRYRGFSLFYSDKNGRPQASLALARAIGRQLVQAGFTPSLHHAERIPGEGRTLVDPAIGLYRFDALAILASARAPAVLLECGIIVNRDEEKLLRDPTYRGRLWQPCHRASRPFGEAAPGRSPAIRRHQTD